MLCHIIKYSLIRNITPLPQNLLCTHIIAKYNNSHNNK